MSVNYVEEALRVNMILFDDSDKILDFYLENVGVCQSVYIVVHDFSRWQKLRRQQNWDSFHLILSITIQDLLI